MRTLKTKNRIGFVDLQDTLSFQIRKTNTSTRT